MLFSRNPDCHPPSAVVGIYLIGLNAPDEIETRLAATAVRAPGSYESTHFPTEEFS